MRRYLLLLITILITQGAVGQDAAFSQFYANRLYLNPAFAGSQQGMTMNSAYRSQWNYIPGGFTTYSFSADIQEPFLNSAFGVMAYQDSEGEGRLTTTSIGFIYGYIVRLGKKSNLHFALKTNFFQKSVDWSKFTFTDQLHPVLGVVRPTNALPVLETTNFADFDFGVVLRAEGSLWGRKTHNNVGFAVHHLNEPNESIQQIGAEDSKLPRRYTFHAGTMFEMVSFNYQEKRTIYLSPNFKFDYQGNIKIVSYGLYAISNPLYLGLFYQNKNGIIDFQNTNSLIFTGGFEGRLNEDVRYTFGYSYDLNTTGLGPRSNGVHEISMMVNFEKASMFGLPSNGRSGKRWRGSKSRRGRKAMECYKFSGANSISIY
jgi:type IX secretion system PorP/SprF family membrane protein